MKIEGQKLPVRRHKGNRGWCIPDENRDYFTGGCQSAILRDVEFVHQARPMSCVSGYKSTGEVIGLFAEVDTSTVTMPADVKRTATIVYDHKRRQFHNAQDVGETINGADFLILNPDGTAIAGWKQ